MLDYSECSKYYRIYNFGNLDFWTNLNVWFDDKLVSDETKLLKNFRRYSSILSEVAESRKEPPEVVCIRRNGSEDHSNLYQHTSEEMFPEEEARSFQKQ